ncbi:MAG TPA: PDZ domain-containing protein [Dokdonella sp.]|uniref:PDZ domain-containing protein n=1 Tax=Dokdonella sp. TaxID=2291710 RepID=UPI002D7EE38E|nr:PDZ domain-containing protein [Dokdonella sp.]HET9034524.1 PDZ domain-containing protein [Dokdonella sp.]
MLSLLLSCTALFAQAQSGEFGLAVQASDSSSRAERRLAGEVRVLLMDMIQSGELPSNPANTVSLQIDSEGERASDLGVLVDTRSGAAAERGLLVLGTTPGGLASKIGFRNGDVIASLNGVMLSSLGSDADGSATAGRVLRETLASSTDGAQLKFVVLRDGAKVALSGTWQAVWIPAFSLHVGATASQAHKAVDVNEVAAGKGCGWINTFDNAPRQQHLHGATLISIDGSSTPLRRRDSYRVSAGRHVLRVGELIENRYLAFNQSFRDGAGADRYKTLVVDVAPVTAYFLAARLNVDQRNEWRDGKFWDPVIWSSKPESCK